MCFRSIVGVWWYHQLSNFKIGHIILNNEEREDPYLPICHCLAVGYLGKGSESIGEVVNPHWTEVAEVCIT